MNNATFPPQFGKRKGQVYLNTWHGTPLKAMGYDIRGGAVDTRNVARNLLSADYLLAPNDDTAKHVPARLPDAQHLPRPDDRDRHPAHRRAVRERRAA